MALRTIRKLGDDILRKECRPLKEVTERTKILIEDMIETMYDANGVGLAAPQVGVLKRLFVVDIGDEEGNPDPHVFVNPEVLETSGEQEDFEGCLSVPGKSGMVKRPNYVKIKAFDEDMNEFEMEAEGFMARAILHENDHLNGVVYVDKVDGKLYTNEELKEMME